MAKKNKKNIIDLEQQRYGMFMSENSFDLDVMYGKNYLQTDNVQTVIIHKMNIVETKTHKLYNQARASDKKFFAPVVISVMLTVENSEQSYYGSNPGGISRDDTGKLIFGVYLDELKEKNIEIDRGDYIEYNMSGEQRRFYEVENANNVTDETQKTIGGFKSYWKKVIATPVKEDVVPFLSETKGV